MSLVSRVYTVLLFVCSSVCPVSSFVYSRPTLLFVSVSSVLVCLQYSTFRQCRVGVRVASVSSVLVCLQYYFSSVCPVSSFVYSTLLIVSVSSVLVCLQYSTFRGSTIETVPRGNCAHASPMVNTGQACVNIINWYGLQYYFSSVCPVSFVYSTNFRQFSVSFVLSYTTFRQCLPRTTFPEF